MNKPTYLDQIVNDVTTAVQSGDERALRHILWDFACIISTDDGVALRVIGDVSCFEDN